MPNLLQTLRQGCNFILERLDPARKVEELFAQQHSPEEARVFRHLLGTGSGDLSQITVCGHIWDEAAGARAIASLLRKGILEVTYHEDILHINGISPKQPLDYVVNHASLGAIRYRLARKSAENPDQTYAPLLEKLEKFAEDPTSW
ncbi:hypothetical protein HY488_03200 [Candidatus Woesearchaeota archaeon]|nr:hypothetical protein [Candidatus Woesearchaeota archaeon]